MLLSEANLIAQEADDAPSLEAALAVLRRMPLDDFGLVLLNPSPYPRLSKLLPSMAPAAVQDQWTGSNGTTLLRQSLTFMRNLESLHARHRSRSLRGLNILDYGCGWGRLMRLALYHTDPGKLFGVDPWDQSIALCKKHRVPGDIQLSQYLPVELPVAKPADVVFAFSVFTHLSNRAARAALRALRKSVAADGFFVFTIRPVEYWNHHSAFHKKTRTQLLGEHAQAGFAFQAHGNIVVDGDATYGDTSMTHAFVTKLAAEEGWRVVGFDRSNEDPFQTLVAAIPG